MDATDRKIILRLAKDGRESLADIATAVDMSTSAVFERVRRLSASGAIVRFTIDADPAALERPVTAFIWMSLALGADEPRFQAHMRDHPALAECHHVTGPWAYFAKAHLSCLGELDRFLNGLKPLGVDRTSTTLVLSSVVPGPFAPKDAHLIE